jgi:hypothetical protein
MNSESTIDFLGTKMAPIPSPDFDYIWIGSKADAANLDLLNENGIQFIVNCTRDHLDGGVKNFHEGVPGMRYVRVPLKDNETEVSSLFVTPILCQTMQLCLLQTAWKFMDRARDVGTGVLVHCAMGKSRSSAVLISYIMHKSGCSYEDGLNLVRSARRLVEPNPAFADRLQYLYLSGEIKDRGDDN